MDKNIPGEFVPLDVHYPRDRAIRQAGEAAELLYLRGLAHSKAAKTHGHIPEYDLEVVGVGLKRLPFRVDALVREGLWEPTDEGWKITGWFKWNKSPEQLNEIAAHRQAAGIKGNHDRWHGPKHRKPDCPHCQEETR